MTHDEHGHRELTNAEQSVLHELLHRGYLPVCRFLMTSTKEDELVFSAMEPVYMTDPADDAETVKGYGAIFTHLEQLGLISLDYGEELMNYPYEEYEKSALFAELVRTVAEGSGKPGFLCDTAEIERGSMALTDEGEEAARELCGHHH